MAGHTHFVKDSHVVFKAYWRDHFHFPTVFVLDDRAGSRAVHTDTLAVLHTSGSARPRAEPGLHGPTVVLCS